MIEAPAKEPRDLSAQAEVRVEVVSRKFRTRLGGILVIKRAMVLLAALALAPALAACGEKKESVSSSGQPQKLTMMLDWFPNADHVGLYQALANGDFERAGLDLHVQVPSDPALPLKLLEAGKIDVAISYEPELLLARNQGLPLVSIAAIVQRSLTSIVSIRSKHIRTVAQLRGKKVGDAGIPYQHAYLSTILARARVPESSVREINVGANLVPAMLSGRVDATIGAYWNYEAIQLARMHKRPNVIRMGQVGVPTYDELVVVARKSTIVNHPDELRRFVQALARGYDAVRRDPATGVRNLVAANPGLVTSFQLASVKATLPSFFPSDSRDPWGWQSASQWNAYGRWMMSHHLITNPAAIADASTNELLAGQGL
jgi:putative hydroxymethylpyrimidine transport system substrate-binding protein